MLAIGSLLNNPDRPAVAADGFYINYLYMLSMRLLENGALNSCEIVPGKPFGINLVLVATQSRYPAICWQELLEQNGKPAANQYAIQTIIVRENSGHCHAHRAYCDPKTGSKVRASTLLHILFDLPRVRNEHLNLRPSERNNLDRSMLPDLSGYELFELIRLSEELLKV